MNLSIEQLLQSADLLSARVIVVSADGVVLGVSATARDRLGLISTEAIGRRLWEIADDGPGTISSYLRVCARTRAPVPGSLTLPAKDGRRTTCRCDGAVLEPSADGAPARILLRLIPKEEAIAQFRALNQKIEELSREIGRRRQLEAALIEADRRKDEFLATLAHELRNPLAPISNALELMRRARGDSGLMEHALSVMERQLKQLVRMVDDLLEISRITKGKTRIRKERVELAAVVRSAIEVVRPLIDRRGHELALTLPSEPIYVEADPARLVQVLANLLDNAAKYTETGGRLSLTAERGDHEIVVSVRDTGIGIAAEHLPRIFDMFSQVTPALERCQGGLGIGLSLVKGLIELHGGTVEAHSRGVGMGSTFTVRLPAPNVASPSAHQVSSPAQASASSIKCRILVVDDNRDAADSLAMVLEFLGHEVHCAYGGPEAIQAAASLRPDVTLLDIGLPKLNGYEVARRLREEPWGKRMVIIALTGWGQESDKRRAYEAGCDHHLTKPVDARALEGLLAQAKPAP